MDKKARIICVTEAAPAVVRYKNKNKFASEEGGGHTKKLILGIHSFYFQPSLDSKCIYLYSTKRYAPSIADFFERGLPTAMPDGRMARSITCGELSAFRSCRQNQVLSKTFDRIWASLRYIIRYELAETDAEVISA